MCLASAVVASQFLAQEIAGLNYFTVMTNICVIKFTEFSEINYFNELTVLFIYKYEWVLCDDSLHCEVDEEQLLWSRYLYWGDNSWMFFRSGPPIWEWTVVGRGEEVGHEHFQLVRYCILHLWLQSIDSD